MHTYLMYHWIRHIDTYDYSWLEQPYNIADILTHQYIDIHVISGLRTNCTSQIILNHWPVRNNPCDSILIVSFSELVLVTSTHLSSFYISYRMARDSPTLHFSISYWTRKKTMCWLLRVAIIQIRNSSARNYVYSIMNCGLSETRILNT